jgi:hypothetical protein
MHHIIPWSQNPQHNPRDMIALCPNHHERADAKEYPDEYLRECKLNPHNTSVVTDAFFVGTENLTVSIASNRFTNIPRILVVDDFDIISLTKEDQCPQLNVNFFDEYDRWVANILENQWCVERKCVWDIEYKPKHLILRSRPRKISFEVKISDDVVFIYGDLFFNSYKIEATEEDLFLDGRSIQMRGCMAEGVGLDTDAMGMNLSTGRTPFSGGVSQHRRSIKFSTRTKQT